MKFRKKPVVIEAIQWNGYLEHFNVWLNELGSLPFHLTDLPNIDILTPEGSMKCGPKDWIIKGAKGEFYPCKPDIFEATYERVEDTESKDEK